MDKAKAAVIVLDADVDEVIVLDAVVVAAVLHPADE